MKALEKSSIKSLSLGLLECSLLPEGFDGIKLESLKLVELGGKGGLGRDVLEDVSKCVNALFDSCAAATPAFPKLLELAIEYKLAEEYDDEADDEDEDAGQNLPQWSYPPRKSILQQFPVLKQITLGGFKINDAVVKYLGEFRRQRAGGSIITDNSTLEVSSLCPERLNLLNTLGISESTWGDFCSWHVSCYEYEDCFYWNCLSDLRFRRIAYAAAFEHATDIPKLKNFLNVVEADLEQSGMALAVLESLKQILKENEKKVAGGEEPSFEWENVEDFIDF
jgi:hypothetical protein